MWSGDLVDAQAPAVAIAEIKRSVRRSLGYT